MRYLSIFIFLIFALSFAVEAKTLKYNEATGSKCREIFWDLKTEKYWTIFDYKREEETYTTTNDLNLNTLQWQFNNSLQNTKISAKRNKNTIQVTGIFKGKSINTQIRIDDDPWYQPMSLSLSKFTKSPKKVITFWTLNPLNLTPYKIKALNYGVETIKVNGKEVRAYKIKVVLSGFRSMFWHAFYWFRENDDTLVLYNGVDGPPNTPMTTINLIEEKP